MRSGQITAPSIPENPANQTPSEIVGNGLCLRRKYHLAPFRIVWCLARHRDIKTHDSGAAGILNAQGVQPAPATPFVSTIRKQHITTYMSFRSSGRISLILSCSATFLTVQPCSMKGAMAADCIQMSFQMSGRRAMLAANGKVLCGKHGSK